MKNQRNICVYQLTIVNSALSLSLIEGKNRRIQMLRAFPLFLMKYQKKLKEEKYDAARKIVLFIWRI